jgi:predicted TIM-barrel fold metal-dependent hydrolase
MTSEPADRAGRRSPLPDDVFVIDAVVHAFNLAEDNVAGRYGAQLHAFAHGLHARFTPPSHVLERDVYMTDMPVEALVRTLFTETQTRLAVTHTLTLHSWFRDGFCSRAKTEEACRRWPERMLGYVGVDPTEPWERVRDDLESQVAAAPGAIGLKLYPHQVEPYRTWHAGEDRVLRLIERARALGLRTVAIHKALPNGSVPLAPYRIDDLDQAADAFPDVAFEIVHSGMAFVEETGLALARFPNVYANLETTTALLSAAPGQFQAVLGELMFWGGPEKLLWATGCTVTHPQPLLERFWALEWSPEVQARWGLPPLDEGIKRAILGGNYARLAGLDVAALAAAQADDEFARARAGGLAAPWTAWREAARARA